jgi:hypothetical protein
MLTPDKLRCWWKEMEKAGELVTRGPCARMCVPTSSSTSPLSFPFATN